MPDVNIIPWQSVGVGGILTMMTGVYCYLGKQWELMLRAELDLRQTLMSVFILFLPGQNGK